jgi:excisionase family DNA binding protein
MAVRAVLDTKQVGQILGVSDETVKRYLADGKVEGFRLPGGRWRIYADTVLALTTPDSPDYLKS